MNILINVLILVSLAVLTGGCSSNLKLNSNWKRQEIRIDGNRDDWQGALNYVRDEKISIGVVNDEGFLYICLASTDPYLQRSMLVAGFTVWLDPKGGQDKTFGIRFPIGLTELGLVRKDRGMARGQEVDTERLREYFQRSTKEFDLIGPDKGLRRRFRISELESLDIKLSEPPGILVYEIKIPLNLNGYDIASKAESGILIGIGFETTKLETESGNRSAGIGGGRGGGGKGGGGRGGGSGSQQAPEQFKFWASIQLSSENTPEGSISVPIDH